MRATSRTLKPPFHKEILHFALAAVAVRPMTRDIADHLIAIKRHVPRSRKQRLLWMVLAVEVRFHARIRRTGR
jgi:hypothetical protein